MFVFACFFNPLGHLRHRAEEMYETRHLHTLSYSAVKCGQNTNGKVWLRADHGASHALIFDPVADNSLLWCHSSTDRQSGLSGSSFLLQNIVFHLPPSWCDLHLRHGLQQRKHRR